MSDFVWPALIILFLWVGQLSKLVEKLKREVDQLEKQVEDLEDNHPAKAAADRLENAVEAIVEDLKKEMAENIDTLDKSIEIEIKEISSRLDRLDGRP